jgi:two-component system sensor histidine kinase HydH
MDVFHEFIVNYLLNICGGLFIAIAVIIYRANKLRPSNRAFSLLVFFGGVWTINYGFITRGGENAIAHLRLGAAIAAFLAPSIIVVRDFIACPRSRFSRVTLRSLPWIVLAVALAALTPLDWFIHKNSPPTLPDYGPGWFWQHIVVSAAMAHIAFTGWKNMRALQGGSRDEMGIAVAYAAGAVAVISAFLAFHKSGDPLPPAEFGLIAILYASRLTWTLLARGVYDARVLTALLVRTASILLGASLVFLLVSGLLERSGLNETTAAVIGSILAAALVNSLTQFFLGRHNALLYRSIAGFQREVNEIARSALTPEKAAQKLEALLAEYTTTADAFLLTEVARDIYQRGPLRLRNHGLDWQRINRAGWIARDTMDLAALAPHERDALRWIDEKQVSLLMLGPRSAQHLNIVVALGRRKNAPAYTFYELECLSLMVESAASALTTIEASTQAQHAGQMMALGLISASVAHEIKQPLAALRLFFKMLPTRYDDARFRSEYFSVIPDELARVESTLSEFLRLGRTESYQVRPFPAHALIRETLTLVQPQAAAHGIPIRTDFPAGETVLLGDPQVLKQALLNLTLNAVQAMSDERLAVRELFVGAALIGGRFELTIRDTGPGISPAVLEKLFRPFVSTKEDGFGLGLYITRDAVVKTGGELHARNLAGGGACFTLLLPLAPEPAKTRAADPAPAIPAAQR